MSNKPGSKLAIYGLIILILLIGMVKIISNSSGLFFRLELLGLLFLLLLSVIGIMAYSTWGENVLLLVFLFYLGNLALIWYYRGSLFFVLIFFTVIGILLCIPKRIFHSEGEQTDEEPHSVVFDEPQKEQLSPPPESPRLAKSTSKSAKSTHSPGKYVASKSSNVYHQPKCDWAKKIFRNRRVWFKNKEEAWEKGYKAHACAK